MNKLSALLENWATHLAALFQRETKYLDLTWSDGAFRYESGAYVDQNDDALAGRHLRCRLDRTDLAWAELEIPEAARPHADGIIKTKLSQISPWNPDKVLFGHDCGDPSKIGEGSATTISVAMANSDRYSLPPSTRTKPYRSLRYEVPSPGGYAIPLHTIDWNSEGQRPAATGFFKAALITVATVSLFGLAGGYAVDAWYDSRQAQLNERQTEARKAIASLRQSLADPGTPEQKLIELSDRDPSRRLSLEALARLIPANTHAQRVEITGNRLRIAGLSDDPTAALRQLANSGIFSQVVFSAPTVRERNGDRLTYEISATIDNSEVALDALNALFAPGSG